MWVTEDIEKFLELVKVIKIQSQPIENDVIKLQKELGQIAWKVPPIPGSGNHCHFRLIIEKSVYWEISNRGVAFVTSNNPEVYPDVPAGVTTAQWERFVTEHKAKVVEYEKCLGVTNALKLKIC